MGRQLVLLTYNLPRGTDLEEYKQYTREIDYPAFRQNPHIQDYANFVVRDTVRGDHEWFRHFDLMFVDDIEAFKAEGRLHFADPTILGHAGNWRERWGTEPQPGRTSSISISVADEI